MGGTFYKVVLASKSHEIVEERYKEKIRAFMPWKIECLSPSPPFFSFSNTAVNVLKFNLLLKLFEDSIFSPKV